MWGGAGTGDTMRANLEAFRRWRIVPRMLRDVSQRDLRTTVLGTEMAAPVMLAPVGVQTILHPEGELASAARRSGGRAARRREHRRGGVDGGGGAGGRRRAPLVPAVPAQGRRDHEELRGARRAGGLPRDRRDPRLHAAGLASGRPRARVPALPPGHGHRAVRDRPRVPRAASRARPRRTCRPPWPSGRRSSTRS